MLFRPHEHIFNSLFLHIFSMACTKFAVNLLWIKRLVIVPFLGQSA
jgi:hypothetical protein